LVESYHSETTAATAASAAALIALALAAGAPAWAQGTGVLPGGVGTAPEEEVNLPPVPGAPPPFEQTKLLGDLGGYRTKLMNEGVDLELGFVGEFGGNVTGEHNGAGYAGQIAFSADIDWGKLAGLTGFSTHYVMINRNGNNFSAFAYGDHVTQALEVYGAGFDMGVKFVYLYGEQKLLDDRLSIAVGRLPVAVDFAASPLYCLPVGLLGCGNPRATTSNAQFTSWPQSTWGGRVRYRPTPETYVQFGAYESDPFPGGGRTGWTWSTVDATGAIIPFELGWEPIFGQTKLPGHYKVGFDYDTTQFNSLYQNQRGGPLLVSSETPRLTNGRWQFWVTADQMLVRQGDAPGSGIILVGTYGNSSSNNSVTWQTAYGSIVDKGFWPSRPNDTIVLSGVYWQLSNKLNSVQDLQAAFGLPIANGAQNPQGFEWGFEADYILPVYRGIYVEPGVSYWVHPNADSRLKDALAFVGRLSIDF